MNKYGDPRAGANRDQLTFREWLVEQLKLSRWSVVSTETVADAARRLGVQEDVLQQAINERTSGKRLHARRELAEQRTLKLWVPEEIDRDFDAYCKILGVTSAIFFRSIAQSYLLNPVTTPAMLTGTWIYRNKRYLCHAKTRTRLLARVSRGALLAIDHRAQQLSIPTAWLLKGLVIDVLEGRMRQIKIVLATDMWGDPKRYLNPELFQAP